MSEPKQANVGELVIFHDTKNKPHNAIVTTIYSPYCINAAYVSSNENEQDNYGRQIKRTASCMHVSTQGMAHGNYWRYPNEEPRLYVAPVES